MMEKSMKKNIYVYNWIALLYRRNYNTVNQLYYNEAFKKWKKIYIYTVFPLFPLNPKSEWVLYEH